MGLYEVLIHSRSIIYITLCLSNKLQFGVQQQQCDLVHLWKQQNKMMIYKHLCIEFYFCHSEISLNQVILPSSVVYFVPINDNERTTECSSSAKLWNNQVQLQSQKNLMSTRRQNDRGATERALSVLSGTKLENKRQNTMLWPPGLSAQRNQILDWHQSHDQPVWDSTITNHVKVFIMPYSYN